MICALVIADCEYFVNFYDKLRVIDPPTPQETTSVFRIKKIKKD